MNNLIKEFFFLSFAEDEVPSDQEIIDVSFQLNEFRLNSKLQTYLP